MARKKPTPRKPSARKIRYGVAMSLDGYIADPHGGYDWIVHDPDIDFGAMFARYDAFLMGRKTFELTLQPGAPPLKGETVVFSRTLAQRDHPHVTIVSDDWQSTVDALRNKPGKDIWLFGGGELFRTMLDARMVDSIDVAIIPVVLGGGVPFLPPPAASARLKLVHHRIHPKSGIVRLEYDVLRS